MLSYDSSHMTEATAVKDGLIKQDQRGRMRVTRERRQMLVAEFEGSAMTGRQFATLAGIKPTTISNWVRKWRTPRAAQLPTPLAANAPGVRWLEAVVEKSGPKRARKMVTPLIVHGPSGVRLELGDEGQVKLAVQLLRGLGREPGC
jgi:transposase-like protein